MWSAGREHSRPRLQRVQCPSGVTAGRGHEVRSGIRIDGERAAEPTLVRQRSIDHLLDLAVGERLQGEQQAA
jgi:hypothetical protein